MKLAEALLPLVPAQGGVVALVGAGGKTSALFRLGSALAGQGGRVLLTSTTHLRDPRLEPGRPAFTWLPRPELETPLAPAAPFQAGPGLSVLLCREAEPGKWKGLHPSWIPALAAAWDFVLVEADGSKGLPVKAPGDHEPVLPARTELVLGVVGLACLGRPMDPGTVHRPERFGAVTGCEPGVPIGWGHLAALVRHPQGLFKGALGPRALLLNQADRSAPPPLLEGLDGLPILLGCLEPVEQVMVFQRGGQA